MACVVGHAVSRLRAYGATWKEILQDVGQGLTDRTLKKYADLYVFCSTYPRFLRVRIAYTALLRYAPKFVEYFETNAVDEAFWKNIES